MKDKIEEKMERGEDCASGGVAEKIEKINLREAFGRFSEQWSPRVAGAVNDAHVKLAKLQGEFVWHHHEHEDEMFLVIQGRLRMQLPGREIILDEGEFLIVPRGLEHRPVADEEVWVMLFEPATTLNTGNVVNERTVANLDSLT